MNAALMWTLGILRQFLEVELAKIAVKNWRKIIPTNKTQDLLNKILCWNFSPMIFHSPNLESRYDFSEVRRSR